MENSADSLGAAGAELGVLFVGADAGAVGPAAGALGQGAGLDLDGQARYGLAGPALDGRVGDFQLGDDAQLRKVRALNALPAGWRGPVIRLYNALAWRLARKGL